MPGLRPPFPNVHRRAIQWQQRAHGGMIAAFIAEDGQRMGMAWAGVALGLTAFARVAFFCCVAIRSAVGHW